MEQTPSVARVAAVFGLTEAEVVALDLDMTPGVPLTAVVPFEGVEYTLDLQPRPVRAPGFQLFVTGADGELLEIEADVSRTLRGTVVDAPGSRVAASLLHDGLWGSIELPDGSNWWIQPVSRYMPGAAAELHVVYHRDAVISPDRPCGTEHGPVPMAHAAKELGLGDHADQANHGGSDGSGGSGGGIAGIECNVVAELGVEADFYYFQDHGSSTNLTQNQMEAVINTVNNQYESQTEITHLITGSIIRTSLGADPYGGQFIGAFTLLDQFRDWWLANAQNIERDVAHLFTGRSLNGGTIGIAWNIAEICTTGAYCLAESDCCCCPSFTFATDLTAHELGHLWGAFHCTCGSFTMNPTITGANNFTTGSVNSIVAHRDSRDCLDDPCDAANDNCDDLVIPVEVGETSFSTFGATTDGPTEAGCDFDGADLVHDDVWFRFSPECDGTAFFRLCEAQFDTRIAVYDFFCPDAPNTAIACNDQHCGDQSQVELPVEVGNFYIIRVGGASAGEEGLGNLDVFMICAPACPADVNGDDSVDVLDLTQVILDWGTSEDGADINDDGIVDVLDLTEVILNWGPC